MQAVSYRLSKETCVVCSFGGKPDLPSILEGSIVTAGTSGKAKGKKSATAKKPK
jgi:hypothetical protein